MVTKAALERKVTKLERTEGEQEEKALRLVEKLDKAVKSIACLKGEIVAQKARADRAEGYIERVRENDVPDDRRLRTLDRRDPGGTTYRHEIMGRQSGKTELTRRQEWAADMSDESVIWYSL